MSDAARRLLIPAAWELWAKSGDDTAWTPLPQHMMDSADVADLLWRDWMPDQLRRRCARLSGLSEDDARVLLRWFACVHDVGKASRQFAGQLDARADSRAFSARIRDAGLPMSQTPTEAGTWIPHAAASRAIVFAWLRRSLGFGPAEALALAAVPDAHHGLPSMGQVRTHARRVFARYEPPWQQTWDSLLSFAAAYVSADAVLARLVVARPLPVEAQLLFTGLVIMADWIASNAEVFPPGVVSDAAAQEARVRAGFAAIDLTRPWRPSACPGDDALYRHRFAWPDDAAPRPVQAAAARVGRQLQGPAIVIIEAPTGEGKTEAALVLAELRAAAEGAGGVFFGAPTMATSDALFHRLLAWAQRTLGAGEVASMFLGHSRAMLNEEFRHLRFRDVASDTRGAAHSGGEAVVASQWMSGRKKGLLSNLIVGTVDQLLVMALQAKHSMLRHVALAGKVVVVDEVHAYDTYMSAYLHRALTWLARYGVTVVLLSATLPPAAKRGLLEAYTKGLDGKPVLPEALSPAYPLITAATSDGVEEVEVARRPADAHVAVQFIDDGAVQVAALLAEHTVEGGCVLVLCNSVIRAQALLDALPPELRADAVLLHARFIASDRAARERALVAELGPGAHRDSGRPRRRIVVATQVAEQSLDIDADLLITDIAPVDLLVQRMGRLHRHARPETDRPPAMRSPRMLVRGLRATAPVPQFDADAAAIYGEHLLLTAFHELRRHGIPNGIVRPDDVPQLVHNAYREPPELPEEWAEAATQAYAEFVAGRTRSALRADHYRFPLPGDITDVSGVFAAEHADVGNSRIAEERGIAQVRDIEPTLEAVLIVQDAGGGYRVLPWLSDEAVSLSDDAAPSHRTAVVLAHSAVRLPRKFGQAARFDRALEALERQTPIGWREHPLLRGLVALRLDAELTTTLAGVELGYGREAGLIEVRSQPAP